ncbi:MULTISPECIES: GNAT family N-acetyltransferase [Pontibacillus]|uniref:GNAT family N-acetyltransferase n=1 Tax=Pontibacillus chungwhensis TaxID=265426 RepID=A0ABY8UZA1_9BACI|nr:MULTISPECIES: GNAT family N-acetyltransferase [Pontibacillus]MCD5325790.1 GNAT family N-acetyltransferase [Pontibacillus sp. HN14]WIF98322.1 GNAT family N-acetyltransferase [Pontibacillus chungwhensis]
MEWILKSYEELSKRELHIIFKERVQVFVVEQNCPYPEVDGDDDQAEHLWLEDQGEIVAYCRLFPSGVKYEEASIGRIFVKEERRGEGHAKVLLEKALHTILQLWGEKAIKIQAQHYLNTFYTSLGFSNISDVYLEDGIPHVDMLLTTAQN